MFLWLLPSLNKLWNVQEIGQLLQLNACGEALFVFSQPKASGAEYHAPAHCHEVFLPLLQEWLIRNALSISGGTFLAADAS